MVLDQNAAPARSVLLVEDEPMLLMVLAEAMRDVGYTVWEAANGFKAIALMEAHTDIDIMITDIKMPDMNGYQLTEKAMELRPNLRILLMTGYAQDPVPRKIAEAGVKVLHKPFDLDRLPVVVESILAGTPL